MRSKQLADAIAATTGVADASKVIKTGADGLLDRSFATSFLNIGGSRKHTRSSTGPSSPVVGDTWDELNVSNQQLYGWTWWWDGAYWRSPDQYFNFYTIGASSSVQGLHPTFLGLNMYIKSFRYFSNTSMAQSGTNYWTINFNRRNLNGTATVLRTATTSTNVLNFWNYNGLSINTHVTTGVNFTIYFDVSAAPSNIPGTLSLVSLVDYQFVRP
jgi:hypothetical protein